LTLNILSFFFNGNEQNVLKSIDKYNKYNAERNIDVKINLIPINDNNATMVMNEYHNAIFSLCSKKSTKYDAYIFYDNYDYNIQELSPYLADYNKYVDNDILSRFPPELISHLKSSDGKLLGIVIS